MEVFEGLVPAKLQCSEYLVSHRLLTIGSADEVDTEDINVGPGERGPLFGRKGDDLAFFHMGSL
jgi:hypothetical protein